MKTRYLIGLISTCLILSFLFSGCRVLFYSRPSQDLRKSNQEIKISVENNNDVQNNMDNKKIPTDDTVKPLKIYYYDPGTDSLKVDIKQGEPKLNNILEYMREPAKDKQLLSAITTKTKIVYSEINDNVLTVDLDASFVKELDVLIAGAAVVNSFIENIADIQYVNLTIDGKAYALDQNSESGLLSEFPLKLEEIRETGTLPGKRKTLDANLYFADVTNKYVISSVREIPTGEISEIVTTIIEQIEKGPLENEIGYLPIAYTPLGLTKVDYVQGNSPGINLYFDYQWVEAVKRSFLLPTAITYSLTESINAEWVKFYYEDENGEVMDAPINQFSFEQKISPDDLKVFKGQRVNIYYGDIDRNYLKQEARAIARHTENIPREIINLEIIGPISDVYHPIIPIWVTPNDIQVEVEETYATVDLPSGILESGVKEIGERMLIYAIVNSLTDTQNNTGIKKVFFKQDGVPVSQFGSMDIEEGLTWNSTIIK